MVCSQAGSSVHGILKARILEWVAHSLLQGIFPIQGSNLGLLHCRQTLYILRHQGRLQKIYQELVNATLIRKKASAMKLKVSR